MSLLEKRLFGILSLAVFVIVLLRAIEVPLFHDEVRTFNHYIKSGILSPYSEYRAANNHLVNTFLARLSYLVFGDSPFSLRLPNVLSFLVYSYFVYKITSWFKSRLGRWTFVSLSLLSFHFVSFFGLSRGYGIGFAFLVAGIYFLGEFMRTIKVKHLIFLVVSFSIALYSFFSLLLVTLIAVSVVIYKLFTSWDDISKGVKIKSSVVLIVFLGIIAYAISILFYYRGFDILWFGFLEGFWKNTVITLIVLLIEPDTYLGVLEVLTVLFFVAMMFFYLKSFRLDQWVNRSNLFFVFLVLNVIGIIVLAEFFAVNYPYQRTGIHLYVLFIGSFSFMIDGLKDDKLRYFLFSPVLILPFHFIALFNFDYISQWEEDTLPYSFFETLKKEEELTTKDYKSSLYIEGTAISVWTYGAYKWYPNLPVCSSNIDKNKRFYDYVIDKKPNMESIEYLYDSIDSQPHSDVTLYKRKRHVKKNLLESFYSNERISSNKDKLFSNFVVDSLASSSLWFNFETKIKFIDYPMHVYLVFSMEDPITHEKYSYKFIEFDRFLDWRNENHKIYTELANDLPLNKPVEIKIYLWNRFERNYEIRFSKLDIYSIDQTS